MSHFLSFASYRDVLWRSVIQDSAVRFEVRVPAYADSPALNEAPWQLSEAVRYVIHVRQSSLRVRRLSNGAAFA